VARNAVERYEHEMVAARNRDTLKGPRYGKITSENVAE
jgi:hypothetical protein